MEEEMRLEVTKIKKLGGGVTFTFGITEPLVA